VVERTGAGGGRRAPPRMEERPVTQHACRGLLPRLGRHGGRPERGAFRITCTRGEGPTRRGAYVQALAVQVLRKRSLEAAEDVGKRGQIGQVLGPTRTASRIASRNWVRRRIERPFCLHGSTRC
jgi:hypothetical protein